MTATKKLSAGGQFFSSFVSPINLEQGKRKSSSSFLFLFQRLVLGKVFLGLQNKPCSHLVPSCHTLPKGYFWQLLYISDKHARKLPQMLMLLASTTTKTKSSYFGKQ